MKKAVLKTKTTSESVPNFIAGIDNAGMRKDCKTLASLMKKVSGKAGKMWGPGIVGFGDIHLKYESGRELDWFIFGFSPRKKALTVYGQCRFADYPQLLAKLGIKKMENSCLYLPGFDKIDLNALEELLTLIYSKHNKKGN